MKTSVFSKSREQSESVLNPEQKDKKSTRACYLLIFGFTLVAILATTYAYFALVNDNDGLFRQEFRQDCFAAWGALFCLLVALVFGSIISKWNFSALHRFFSESPNRKLLLFCSGALCLYMALMQGATSAYPLVPDEYCALFQSQIFAAGRFTGKIPADLSDSFFYTQMLRDFVVFSQKTGSFSPTYWPGFALVMSPFTLLGLSWACNAFITVLSLYLFFLIGRKLGGTNEAGFWALIFALASSVIAINAATFYAMPTHLLANLLFCWLIIQNQRRATLLAGLLGGFALGLHNPVPHATFALPWVIWMALRRREHLWVLLSGYALIGLPLVFGWSAHLNTFDVKRYILEASSEDAASKGTLFSQVISRARFVFQPPSLDLLLWRGAGVIKAIVWACPGLIALAWCGWRKVHEKTTAEENSDDLQTKTYLKLLGSSVLCAFVFYLFVRYDQGHGWGYRYLHHVWLAFPLLASYYMVKTPHRLLLGKIPFKPFMGMVALSSILFLFPLHTLQVKAFMANVLQNGAGRAIAAQENSIRESEKGVSIVFISEKDGILYSYLIQNDPFLRNRLWKFRFADTKKSEQIARKYMKNAKLESRNEWGEVWTGDEFTLLSHS